MKQRHFLPLVALLGVASTSSMAATIDVTYANSADFGNGQVGYITGAIAPNPNSNNNLGNVSIGGISFTTSNVDYDFSSSGQFNAWCVDIYHWMSNGSTIYDVATASDLATELSKLRPGTLGQIRVDNMIKLANQVYSFIDTTIESAAFQLAIWEIAYGTPSDVGNFIIDTADTNFRVKDSTLAFVSLANNWLNGLATAENTGNYTLTYLNDGTRNKSQDVIVFTETPLTPSSVSVPEPNSFALIGLGLAGFTFIRRKEVQRV
ncbi:MAG: PEP-CTERM sorting domain-containing protein [Methylomonas sp.]|nr:PEP-CTERM sorting domain-containing protein [Methylomonas sp.]